MNLLLPETDSVDDSEQNTDLLEVCVYSDTCCDHTSFAEANLPTILSVMEQTVWPIAIPYGSLPTKIKKHQKKINVSRACACAASNAACDMRQSISLSIS